LDEPVLLAILSRQREAKPEEITFMQDRRCVGRVTTLFRPALIETEDFVGFCLVKNLSPTGMMAKIYTQLREGERIGVQFCHDITAYGSVIWSNTQDIGVTFDQDIDVPNILASINNPSQDGQLPRAPRLPLKVDGHVMIDNRPFAVKLRDISQKGVKITGFPLKPDEEIVLCLDGLAPKKCVVRWAQLGANGLRFVQPLRFDQLGDWVVSQQLMQMDDRAGGSRSQLEGQIAS
jgi:hypothetical protein